MKLATIRLNGKESAALHTSRGYLTIEAVNRACGADWPEDLLELIQSGRLQDLKEWYRDGGERLLAAAPTVSQENAELKPLYRNPGKIWGIGMNYVRDEAELRHKPADEEPVGFMKPATALIGPNDAILLPSGAGTITAEAELAIIIGKRCRHLTEEEAHTAVAGFTTALDMTAADVHGRNPRFLTRAKSYDTFLSLGPQLVTPDEIPDVLRLSVSTVLNGEEAFRNRIFNMKFRPWHTVAFHSSFMTLLPGDVILTGTPGPVVIRDGDTVECRIDGFAPLANPVARLEDE
ncbi:fumarylacetoacetate hydrolase family protein [Paenibacillus arenilitoris]|uniref:Fumarylacetoacetate hydrolase family protein n=1 Tax=Paenibacillus arenilitoris TaxID=2772299 RepID=A0A927H5Q1_9BACL|nr:fumarylacetoacetate hydrolase family protein [Paenibacillus arenilitoris]MBD2868667.1 fumarylacetoacetate hydrolase family protein [Paenibacillus arenilitoris]